MNNALTQVKTARTKYTSLLINFFIIMQSYCLKCTKNKYKQVQSNFRKGRIAPCLYSPGGSTQQFAIACLAWGLDPKYPLPLGWGVSNLHLTRCVTRPHKCACQVASKSVEWFKQGARM